MMTLYAIADEYKDVLDSLEDGELDDATRERLDSVEHALTEKATNIAAYIRDKQILIEAMKNAEKEIHKRRQAEEKRVDWLQDYLLANMENTGISKIECPWFRIGIRKNPASVKVDDIIRVPDDCVMIALEMKREDFKRAEYSLSGLDYLVTDVKVLKAPIKARLEKGEDIKGVHLTQSKRVQID